jgi:hypothetical protein
MYRHIIKVSYKLQIAEGDDKHKKSNQNKKDKIKKKHIDMFFGYFLIQG